MVAKAVFVFAFLLVCTSDADAYPIATDDMEAVRTTPI